jgi:hypothetical protein
MLAEVTYAAPIGAGGNVHTDLLLRRQSNFAHYRLGMYVTPTNVVWMRAQQNDNTIISPVKSNLTFTPGDSFLIRAQVVGTNPTTIRARVWKRGTPEPSTWLISGTDNHASLQSAGSVGVRVLNAGSSSVTLKFDDLLATRL